MELTRAYKFRIYPDTKRQSEMELQLTLSKEFYNLLLEKSIKSYKEGNKKLSMAHLNKFAKEIEKDRKFLQIYSQTRCEIKYRVLKAYQNFFRRVKEKKSGKRIKVGFPRFKSKDRYCSITYPQDNGSFAIVKKNKKQMLRVSRIGCIQIKLHRGIEGKIKTLTIKKTGREYLAIFTTVMEIEPPKVENTNPVGIDMGLNSFIALSDGTKIEKPKFAKKAEKHIARWQRIIAKRHKGSKRRESAKLKLQKKWEDVANQSNDFAHKLSDKLVNSRYTSFAVEDLHIQNMVKNHNLAQSIYDASWNRFIQMLSYKAESAGMKVIKVDARNTSKECSNCGNIQDMPLSIREYICSRCDMQMDRDINASINILHKATTLGQRESHAQVDMASAIQQESKSRIEELRTNKTHPLQNAVIA
jgi:putative transposase